MGESCGDRCGEAERPRCGPLALPGVLGIAVGDSDRVGEGDGTVLLLPALPAVRAAVARCEVERCDGGGSRVGSTTALDSSRASCLLDIVWHKDGCAELFDRRRPLPKSSVSQNF